MNARSVARKAAKAAVLPLGIRALRPGDLMVLLYHRIWLGTGPPRREIDVAAAAFDRQMASLAEGRSAIHLDGALASFPASTSDGDPSVPALPDSHRARFPGTCGVSPGGADPTDENEATDRAGHDSGKEDPHSRNGGASGASGTSGAAARVVVTFDDGFRDFVEVALPTLVAHEVPATLYLTTGLVRGGGGGGRATEDHLSWRDLADALTTGLVTIGAHTHTHPDLSQSNEAVARDEMQRSRDLIEDHFGVACRHFAYPYSKSSPAAEGVARELFDSGALAWGTNRAGRVNLHRLARVPVLRSDGSLFFRAKVRGRLDGEALVYQALRRGPWRAS